MRGTPQTIAAAVIADRVRIDNILSSPEAKRNPALAQRLAVVRGMDEATARDLLKDAKAENPYTAALEMHGAIPVPGAPAPGTTALGGVSEQEAFRARAVASARAFNASRG